MFKLSNTSVVARLFLLVVGALLAIVVLTAVFIASEHRLLMDERTSGVRHNVEVALGIVAHYEDLSRQGNLSVEQAQRQALDAVRALRYGSNDYFWVHDVNNRMLMHPFSPKLNGTDMSGYKDPAGKLFFAEMTAKVRRSGQGFVDYLWPKPGREQPQPKISYVKGLPAWGWVIGSGVYIDNVDQTLIERALGFGGAALAIFALLLLLGLVIARSILRQLGGEPRDAADVTRQIAGGDLGARIDSRYPGEDNLLNAIRAMRDQLADTVSRVRRSAESVATASAEIAQGNQDLSVRTEQHASGLERTASSMEEFGVTVRQNADSARQANELAQSASAVAAAGGEVVSQVVDTMREISASSQKIAEIIGVIDGIAFQTNILALNAAVEAARAGEQGRGFAVVAGEVRTLAQRSAAAAKEIKDLIQTSVHSVDQGSALVGKAGATMREVVASIRNVTEIVGTISQGTEEQNAGLVQVNDALRHMDGATQQNAALVEEMAAAASNLNELAQELLQTMAAFRLEAGGRD